VPCHSYLLFPSYTIANLGVDMTPRSRQILLSYLVPNTVTPKNVATFVVLIGCLFLLANVKSLLAIFQKEIRVSLLIFFFFKKK
jgi:ABC-type multidrug transport system permease subunit